MKKMLFFVFFALISAISVAQVNSKYLVGAVPEVDGRIVFTSTIKVEKASKAIIFKLLSDWIQETYNSDKNRVLLFDSIKGDIACIGQKELIFKSSTWVLDKAKMNYQIIFKADDDLCTIGIRNIKYDYSPDKLVSCPAENLISDKIALDADKLNRYYDKFRTHTIDTINTIFESIDVYLNGTKAVGGTVSKLKSKSTLFDSSLIEVISDSSAMQFAQYKKILPENIPVNYIKLLGDWMLITSGSNEKMNTMTASWGGLGVLWDKPIVFSFINPTRYSIQTMDQGDIYTLSFYENKYKNNLQLSGTTTGKDTDKISNSGLTPIKTPLDGLAFSEAWMILECRKIVCQPIQENSVLDKPMAEKWSGSGYHNIYIGEIVNVWIK